MYNIGILQAVCFQQTTHCLENTNNDRSKLSNSNSRFYKFSENTLLVYVFVCQNIHTRLKHRFSNSKEWYNNWPRIYMHGAAISYTILLQVQTRNVQ